MKVTEQGLPQRAGTGEMKNNLLEMQSYTPAAQTTIEILLLYIWHLSENKIGKIKKQSLKDRVLSQRCLWRASC